jgi:hypothetical protein
MVSLVVVAQVLLVLEDLVAVLALEDVVVLVSLLVPFPGKKTSGADPDPGGSVRFWAFGILIQWIHMFWPLGSGSWRIRMFFGLPDPGSISTRYGSGSGAGSFYHQAKIVRKTFIPTIL